MAGMFETAGAGGGSNKEFKAQLNKVYGWYTGGFAIFVVALAILEQMGLSREWIGFIFLLATIGLYAGIGIMSRTTDAAEYYVAGRRVPAVYNGMATGADWMSAASFIGLAGTLYMQGFNGLAFVMGWTGGYCLVAFFLAPYLRKFGQFTIPDFLGERYGGRAPRLLGIGADIVCSFIYVVAQIYGVGLITSRLTGVAFELGVFLGLGGILVCSFLGGMRAVTWTQVAQYVILIAAYMTPVVWLSVKQTQVPLPQLVYGQQLQKVTQQEQRLSQDPKELEVQALYRERSQILAQQLENPVLALATERRNAQERINQLRAMDATPVALTIATGRLARAGLLRASFIPPVQMRQLRLVARQRQKLVGMCSAEKNRLHKVLVDAGIRINVVVADIHGASARAMVKALIADKPMHEVLDRKGLEKASCGCYAAMRGVMKDLGVPRPNASTH